MKVLVVTLALLCSVFAQPHISLDENDLSEIGVALDNALKTLDTSDLLDMDLTAAPATLDSERHHHRCGQCVRHAAVHIMHAVIEHIKEHCEHTKCPFEKKRCEEMARHKHVVFGYLLEKVQPAKLGFFFCLGHGDCGHGDRDNVMNSTALEPLDPRMDVVIQPADGDLELQASIFADGLSSLNVTTLWDLDSTVPLPEDDKQLADSTEEDDNHRSHRRCIECVGCVSAHVMRHVVEHIVEFCRHTHCPVMKRHCEWAAHHREVVFGILLAKVEPHKFAFGACVEAGRCGHHH